MQTDSSLTKLAKVAITAAFAGGREIMEVYARADFGVRMKEDHSPLTEADLRSNRVIESLLEQTGIPVMSEESTQVAFEERSGWKLLWVVDPLDGTKEFIKRNGEFTVNIALVQEGCPVLGVVLVPAKGLLYVGYHGEALKYTLGDWIHETDPLQGAACTTLPYTSTPEVTMVASISHFSPETAEYAERLRTKVGSLQLKHVGSSLKICILAEGAADVYPRFGTTMEWDTAAGQAVLEASGGFLWELSTMKPLTYNRKELKNPNFLAVGKGFQVKGIRS